MLVFLVVFSALVLSAWRIVNPPIEARMEKEFAEAEAQIEMCRFMEAYDAYRRIVAMDGRNEEALHGMTKAGRATGQRWKHRRYGKGCGVSLERNS